MALSDVKIRNLKPNERPYKVADFDGLYIHVIAKGTKLWRLKYRMSGKEKLLAIGTYPAVSLLAARKARDDARTQIAKGVDPSQLKRENAYTEKDMQSRTFSRVAELYLNKIEKEGRAEATLEKIRWYQDARDVQTKGAKPFKPIFCRWVTTI